jgi:4-aminobutyrate aminotransferase-like enzyme/Ser/Thr protein kinase RdoA (MazF antagonist)
MNYLTTIEVEKIVKEQFNIIGKATKLDGEIDWNYKISSPSANYLLKITPSSHSDIYLDFQVAILDYIALQKPSINYPKIINNLQNNQVSVVLHDNNNLKIRLLTWMEGRLWSSVNPKTSKLRENLGKQCGLLSQALKGFSNPFASREFEWDLAQSLWTENYLHLFEDKKLEAILFFQNQFKNNHQYYQNLRKQVVHNDANDNNIIVSNDILAEEVEAVIDYGDAVYTQLINDVAVTIVYAIMDLQDPLSGAIDVLKGYNSTFSLQEEELEMLYNLIGMRLVVSVTKSAINKTEHPENKYLQISDQSAWDLIHKWKNLNSRFVYLSFRNACGYNTCPNQEVYIEFISKNAIHPSQLFKNRKEIKFEPIDLSIGSEFLGNQTEFSNDTFLNRKFQDLLAENPDTIYVGGYKEPRALYNTDAFKQNTNDGVEYRTLHLGVDFWTNAGEAVFAPFDAEVISAIDNNYRKDYGPTLILKHKINDNYFFYTLYGHLSRESLEMSFVGKKVKQGEQIATLGSYEVNGNWSPHLHFQVILDLLGNTDNFNGVSSPSQWEVYGAICPDPNIIFNIPQLKLKEISATEYFNYRKQHLGKSLSLSYQNHLTIMRGSGVNLYDQWAQPYLDTVNNVPHVGHQNPRVVKAGQSQMVILNTNTRYLHPKINEFAKELLATFPPELCVVHFVNSGSEANELAMRMAKTITKQKDIIALEMGYHGNTQGCVDISSYKFNRKGGSGKPEHTAIVPLPDAFRGKYRGEGAGEKYATHLSLEIEKLKEKGRNVACFIAESIVSCGGQIDLPENYLKNAYEIVRKEGGLCISDEVQVGFGRVGSHFWGFQMHDVIPDIVTMGKPIGNGHPLAAVVCTKAVAEGFANGMEYFNTFGGNPVSCAIGLAVLEEIKEKELQKNALLVGEYLTAKLKEMQLEFPLIADVRGKGLFLGIEFLEPDFVPATLKTKYITERMKDRSILMSIDGPDNNVLKIKPPICFSIQDADYLIENLKIVLQEDFVKY